MFINIVTDVWLVTYYTTRNDHSRTLVTSQKVMIPSFTLIKSCQIVGIKIKLLIKCFLNFITLNFK